jgi:hypothetical protein
MRPPRAMKRLRCLACLVVVAAVLAACATQPTMQVPEAPGFWSGLFHGFTILITLIASFLIDVRIYAFPNAGLGYDVGFFLGASVFLGSSVLGAGAGG